MARFNPSFMRFHAGCCIVHIRFLAGPGRALLAGGRSSSIIASMDATRVLLRAVAALPLVWLAAHPGLAQDCATQAQTRAGQWSQGEDAGTGSGRQPGLVQTLDGLAEIVRRAYPNPVGAEAKWYRVLSTTAEPQPAIATYDLASNYRGYYCGTSQQPFLASETGTWAYIHVNNFGFKHLTYRVEHVELDGLQAYALAPRVGSWDGYDLHDLTAPEEPKIEERVVLITRAGESPYRPVSKKAFLLANRTRITQLQQDDVAVARSSVEIRPVAEQEAEKQYYLDELEKYYTGDALQAHRNRLLADWRTDEQKRDEAIGTARQTYQPLLDTIARLLAEDEAALSEAAVIRNRSWSLYDLASEPLFVPEDQGFTVITLDPAYFEAPSDPTRPQFMAVYWSWDIDQPFAEHFAAQFRQNLDVAALAALLRP